MDSINSTAETDSDGKCTGCGVDDHILSACPYYLNQHPDVNLSAPQDKKALYDTVKLSHIVFAKFTSGKLYNKASLIKFRSRRIKEFSIANNIAGYEESASDKIDSVFF
jgi:hypothetical protein